MLPRSRGLAPGLSEKIPLLLHCGIVRPPAAALQPRGSPPLSPAVSTSIASSHPTYPCWSPGAWLNTTLLCSRATHPLRWVTPCIATAALQRALDNPCTDAAAVSSTLCIPGPPSLLLLRLHLQAEARGLPLHGCPTQWQLGCFWWQGWSSIKPDTQRKAGCCLILLEAGKASNTTPCRCPEAQLRSTEIDILKPWICRATPRPPAPINVRAVGITACTAVTLHRSEPGG